jgi:hypothetical protein
MINHDEILVDKQKAQEYAAEYLKVVLHNMNAAGLMISSAMAKFTKFVNLPEAKTASFWEQAVRAIDSDPPVFGFSKLFSEQERAIDKATLGIAAASGDWRAKLNDQKEPPDGIKQLNKLDSTKPIIQELLEASQKALVVWAKTIYLVGLATEPILAKIQKLLSTPAFPTQAELDQIESACLWKMIRDWVSANVFWLETIIMVPKIGTTDMFIRAGTETTLEGINNNQVATIAALFGPGVPRGKYFNAPAITYGWNALDYWGVSTRYRKVYRNQAAASGSL